MSILIVGSVAYDSVTTSYGTKQDALGGSATYASISGSYFAPVEVVAVVGEDFDRKDIELLQAHQVEVSGIKVAQGKTFRWAGEYSKEDVNSRETLDTQLNVFADFQPRLTAEQRRLPYLFLANIDPELQLDVLRQMEQRPQLVAADTMNFWIDGKKEQLAEVVKSVDVIFMDEGEARTFSGEVNIVTAAQKILSLGPTLVIVKRGDHGVIQFTKESVFAAPAFPLRQVVDPTGAGDSFAGGFMGYMAANGDSSEAAMRRATVLGSVMGSFAVESFSVGKVASLTHPEVTDRVQAFYQISQFDGLQNAEYVPRRK